MERQTVDDPVAVTQPSSAADPLPAALTGSLPVGHVVAGRYRIDRLLGAGGMGEVYKVWDQQLDIAVALKVIRPATIARDPDTARVFADRFKRELLAARQVTHTNVVRIFDLGEADGLKYLTMAFVDGDDLATLLTRTGRMPGERLLALARQLASGLAAAHEAGVVHRDLKPQNLMVDGHDHLCISDFGLATSLERSGGPGLTMTGEFLGTPRYLSPEQVEGKPADARSDLYAMGLILYEMATGESPFSGSSALEVMYQRMTVRPANVRLVVPELPPALAAVIAKLLQRDPAQRYESAREVLVDLDATAASAAPAVDAPALPVPSSTARRPAVLKLSVAAVAVLTLLLAGVLWVRARPESPDVSPGGASTALPASSERRLLAVLPFTVAGDPATLTHIAVGAAEALSAKLFQRSELTVASPSAVERIDLKQPTIAIARALGVNLILTGTVQGGRDRIRITARLEDVVAGERLWADEQSGPLDDMLALEDQLFAGLSRALNLSARSATGARSDDHPTENVAAYDLYLRGRSALRSRQDPKNVQAAIAFFEDAIARDPNFALAYTGIADASGQMFNFTRESLWAEKALHAANRAVALDRDAPEVHFALGSVHTMSGRHADAMRELQRAVELVPHADEGYRRLGTAYLANGQAGDAIASFERAVAINPYYWLNHNALGAAHLQLNAPAKAIPASRRVTELEPQNVAGHNNLGAAYLLLGEYDKAARAFQRSLEVQPTSETYSNLGTALFYDHKFAEAIPFFTKAVEISPSSDLWMGNLADGYRWAGRTADALASYDRAIALAFKELQINPRNTRVKRRLALYYAKKGDTAQARTLIDEVLASAPSNANALYASGVVDALASRPSEAIAALRGAVAAGYPLTFVEGDPELAELRERAAFASVRSARPQSSTAP